MERPHAARTCVSVHPTEVTPAAQGPRGAGGENGQIIRFTYLLLVFRVLLLLIRKECGPGLAGDARRVAVAHRLPEQARAQAVAEEGGVAVWHLARLRVRVRVRVSEEGGVAARH